MQKHRCLSKPHDIVIYTGGLVTKDQSGWVLTVKQGGRTVHDDSGSHRVTTSSLTLEVKAVTHAIQRLASQRGTQITYAIILTDSMNPLHKMESGMGCSDWHTAMQCLRLQKLLLIYCPGHAGVCGNERVDRLASTADITSGLQLGRAEVLRGLRSFLNMDRPEHHSIGSLKERGVEKGSGGYSTLRGTICIQPDMPWLCSEGNLGENAETRGGGGGGGARMGLSEHYDAILS